MAEKSRWEFFFLSGRCWLALDRSRPYVCPLARGSLPLAAALRRHLSARHVGSVRIPPWPRATCVVARLIATLGTHTCPSGPHAATSLLAATIVASGMVWLILLVNPFFRQEGASCRTLALGHPARSRENHDPLGWGG